MEATDLNAAENAQRRLSIGFLNIAHGLDHYIMLIFPTVVIGLEAVYKRPYGELITLSTICFTAFGLFAVPFGWLADKWSRRNMIAIFYLGSGVSLLVVGLSQDFIVLAIALSALGIFAAIYHPVGLPMLIDAAVDRGRTVAFNGVCGNLGVALAAGITGALAGSLGWRWAFFVPAVILLAVGIVYLMIVPHTPRKAATQLDSDVPLLPRTALLVICLFLFVSFNGGLVFNAMSVALPKLVDERIGGNGIPLALVGQLTMAVFLCGAVAQLSVGRLVGKMPPHLLLTGIATMQFLGIVWIRYVEGWALMLVLAFTVAAIYAQITVNDVVLARYAPPSWRGRTYALRFFIAFTPAGPVVWLIGRLHERGGFDQVLSVTAVAAAVFAITCLIITLIVANVESTRRRQALAAE